jgi:hypothetical protein
VYDRTVYSSDVCSITPTNLYLSAEEMWAVTAKQNYVGLIYEKDDKKYCSNYEVISFL